MALPMALGTSLVLGTMATSAVAYSSWNYGSSARSNAEVQALALAEAGLNYAYSTLYNASPPTDPLAVPDRTVTLETGTARYYGVLNGSTWTLTGIGTAVNPTGRRSAAVVRVVSGRVTLGSALVSSRNNGVWNYVYADATSGCTTLSNSVRVDVPLYVRGDLCISNTASVTGGALRVGGTLTVTNSGTVGSSAEPIYEASIAGGCRYGNSGPFHTPCTSADHVYAQVVDATPPPFTKPAVDLAKWYRDSQPGPLHGCTTGSFPGGFDNDTVMNHSRPPVDLTPTTAYDCRVLDESGFEVGRLAWNPATEALTLRGTIFFDGDIVFSQQNEVVYSGQATIYTSGIVDMSNHNEICGAPGCPDSWNPNQSLLAFVAGSISGEQNSVVIGNYTYFQGAIYGVNDYREGNNSQVWGPVIARQVYLQNSTVLNYVPIDTLLPGMPATYEETVTLTNVPGSWG